VKDAINAYRDSNDWLGNFLGECCEIGSDLSEKSGGLYQAYRAYCLRNGEFTHNTSDFYTALDVMGFERKKTNKGNLMTGLKLREEACLD